MHKAALEALPVLLLFLVSILFACGALVAGVVALCTRDKARSVSTSTLLVLATIPMVCLVMIPFVAKKQSEGPFSDEKTNSEVVKFCLNLGTAIPIASNHNPLLKSLLDLGYPVPSAKSLMDGSRSQLKQQVEVHPKNGLLAAKYALVCAASEEPVQACKLVTEQSSRLPNSRILKVVSELICAKETIDQETQEYDKNLITKYLPAGWFQESALLLDYKASGNSAAAAELTKLREAVGLRAVPKLLAVIFLVGSFNLFGLIFSCIAIAKGAKLLPNQENFHSKILTFRAVYGVMLFAVYFQLLTLGAVSLVCWLTGRLEVLSTIFLPAGIFSMALAYFIGFYLFVLLPQGLKLANALSIVSLQTNLKSFPRLVLIGFATFSVLLILDTCWNLGTDKFIHSGTNNPISGQLVSWSNSPNLATALFSFFSIGLLAPLGKSCFSALYFMAGCESI